MALPAIKGVIIIGGIAVAVGVALSEHEPFREWADETWRKTNKAFVDFIENTIPEARRRRHHAPWGAGPEYIPWNRGRREQGWPFKRRQSPRRARDEPGQAQAESSARGEEMDGTLRRRRRGPGGENTQLDNMSAKALSDEAILEQATADSPRRSLDADRRVLGGPAQTQQVEDGLPSTSGRENANKYTSGANPALESEATNSQAVSQPQEDVSSSPSTESPTQNTRSHIPLSSNRSESGMSDDSLDILSAPQYTPPDSDAELLDDDRSDTGTETMSHVSQDPEMGGDVDEVRSMASSWSQVSDTR